MTPVQIAYFKHFLFDSGIQAIYISMYKRHRIKGDSEGDKNGNPESLEQFLQEQPPFRVLTKAFYFLPGSNYGYDYWNEINKKWLKYLDLHADNPHNEKVVILKGSFAILRQNWDKDKYWKTEPMEKTYKRMHIEPPLEGVDLETAFIVPRRDYLEEIQHKFKVGDIIESAISKEVLTVTAVMSDVYEVSDGGIIDFDKEDYWTKIGEEVEEDKEDNPIVVPDNPVDEEEETGQESLLDGFSLVETTNTHGGKKMRNNTVSVNLRNNGYRVTFSSKQSDRLRKNGYKYVKLLTKGDSGEIALLFNNQSGCSVSIKKGSKESRNVTINSKDIVEHIAKFYNLKSTIDYFTLEITATIQQNLDIIYKLKFLEWWKS